ncbi:MAG: uracil-DNA glycosylase [Brachymonas sp.]|nr:uracil-DNA glycosylase [Brachymonas sp.]
MQERKAVTAVEVKEAALPAAQPLPDINMQMDLPALRTAASQCQACRLCAGRQHSVWDTPPQALPEGLPRWLFVLDAPGPQENAAGAPLLGDAGQLLANMAAAVRLQPAQVYRAHATKCAPLPGHKVSQSELTQCAHWLRHEIARVQPQMVLALGRHAAFSLTGSAAPLGQLRGQPHRMVVPDDEKDTLGALAAIPVVVSYPPSYLLRTPAAKREAWQDLCMAHALLQPQQGAA